MINDNLLADRLNAYRNNESIPEILNEENSIDLSKTSEQLSKTYDKANELSTQIYKLVGAPLIILRSVAYGISLNELLMNDWNFITILAIGFSIDVITNNFFNLFKK